MNIRKTSTKLKDFIAEAKQVSELTPLKARGRFVCHILTVLSIILLSMPNPLLMNMGIHQTVTDNFKSTFFPYSID